MHIQSYKFIEKETLLLFPKKKSYNKFNYKKKRKQSILKFTIKPLTSNKHQPKKNNKKYRYVI